MRDGGVREHTEQIFNIDNPEPLVPTVRVSRIAHNLAFVFPGRLDYGNGERTSDPNSVWQQIPDASYCSGYVSEGLQFGRRQA